MLSDVGEFSSLLLPHVALRGYQAAPARAIADLVTARAGGAAALVFSRQAGKDETLAQLLAWLLLRSSRAGGAIVVAAPTRVPQANISRDRLLARLRDNALTRPLVSTSDGYIVRVGRASARFLSAQPTANARGQTADLLLVANEAQDIDPGRWDSVFAPMAASTNAPTLFMGTVWTTDTLLARAMRHAATSGTLWRQDWRAVAAEVPAYGQHVKGRIAALGEGHPFIRTEYELHELDGDGGLFTAQRQALLAGTHPRQRHPHPGQRVVFLVDVAGADEEPTVDPGASYDPAASRDATALTIAEVVPGKPPSFRTLDRYAWTNAPMPQVRTALLALMERWAPVLTVIDATGIGHGLYQWLKDTAPRRLRIEPFVFTSASKSALGWSVVALIEAGRITEYVDDGDPLTRAFWAELGRVTYEVLPGPNHTLRWSVPAGAGHDDLVLSWALVAAAADADLRSRRASGSPG